MTETINNPKRLPLLKLNHAPLDNGFSSSKCPIDNPEDLVWVDNDNGTSIGTGLMWANEENAVTVLDSVSFQTKRQWGEIRVQVGRSEDSSKFTPVVFQLPEDGDIIFESKAIDAADLSEYECFKKQLKR